MRAHSFFTIVAEISDGEVERLGALLDEIGDDIDDNPHLRFADLSSLHYASFVIVDCPGPHLLFEGNIDGAVPAFLEQLVATAGDAVATIYSHCAGFPAGATSAAMVDYLASRDIGADAVHVAWHGRTVEQICAEQELRERLGRFLDEELQANGTPAPLPSAEDVRSRLQQFVLEEPSLSWAGSVPERPFLVRNGRLALVLLAAPVAATAAAVVATATGGRNPVARRTARMVLAVLAAALGAGAHRLRQQEKAQDRRDVVRHPDWQSVYADWSENLARIVQRENVQGQNHLASVCRIKEGPFRLALLRLVLFVVNLVARLTSNKGTLSGISSIHFARWVITPDRRHLVFLSNFDGSWERYLNDFIDLASPGLTAVWTNTDNEIGFPSTRWLAFEGARDEQRFKSYARYSQARTRAWYSAYPDLSNENIANNIALREQLFVPLDRPATEAWLRRL